MRHVEEGGNLLVQLLHLLDVLVMQGADLASHLLHLFKAGGHLAEVLDELHAAGSSVPSEDILQHVADLVALLRQLTELLADCLQVVEEGSLSVHQFLVPLVGADANLLQ